MSNILKEHSKAAGQVELTAKSTKARLVPTEDRKSVYNLSEVVCSLDSGRKLYLIVGDLRTDLPPGTTYDLFIDLPDGASKKVSDRHFIGSINFYGATRSKDPAKAPRSTKFESFDVTSVVESLNDRGELSKESVITIVPSGDPAKEAHPRIGRLSLQEQ